MLSLTLFGMESKNCDTYKLETEKDDVGTTFIWKLMLGQ